MAKPRVVEIINCQFIKFHTFLVWNFFIIRIKKLPLWKQANKDLFPKDSKKK